jgi:hypothetical protein
VPVFGISDKAMGEVGKAKIDDVGNPVRNR